MKVVHDVSNGAQIVIFLLGTPVLGHAPNNGMGRIHLTPYGARDLAYDLLKSANDAEHYERVDKGQEKNMTWIELCTDDRCFGEKPHTPENCPHMPKRPHDLEP